MLPPATTGVPNPSPRPDTFQARGGPLFGHVLSRQVSFDRPVRSGPRHCGQSAAAAPAASVAVSARPSAAVTLRLMVVFRKGKVPGREGGQLLEAYRALARWQAADGHPPPTQPGPLPRATPVDAPRDESYFKAQRGGVAQLVERLN